eukprot:5524441-Amphidinium_carterae.2
MNGRDAARLTLSSSSIASDLRVFSLSWPWWRAVPCQWGHRETKTNYIKSPGHIFPYVRGAFVPRLQVFGSFAVGFWQLASYVFALQGAAASGVNACSVDALDTDLESDVIAESPKSERYVNDLLLNMQSFVECMHVEGRTASALVTLSAAKG